MGRQTAAHSVIVASGAENVAEFDGIKPMSPEAVLADPPDILLMTDEHAVALGGVEAVAASPLFGPPEAPRPKTVTISALTVLSIGPRTPESIRLLRAHF